MKCLRLDSNPVVTDDIRHRPNVVQCGQMWSDVYGSVGFVVPVKSYRRLRGGEEEEDEEEETELWASSTVYDE